MELLSSSWNAKPRRVRPVVARALWARNIDPFKVRAQENGTRFGRGTGQKPLRTPDKQVMSKEPNSTLNIAVVIIITLPTTYGTEPIWTDGPGKSRHEEMRHARAVNRRAKQALPAAVAVVTNTQLLASSILWVLRRGIGLIGTEPGSHLQSQAA